MVFCSRPAGEGMPGVLIEAGLSGLPVVATAVPGVTSIVEDGTTGFVVPVDDLPPDGRRRRRPDRRSGAPIRHRGGGPVSGAWSNFSLATVAARWLAILQPLLDADRARRIRP